MSGRVAKGKSQVRSRPNQRESRDKRALVIEEFGSCQIPCSNCIRFGSLCYYLLGFFNCNCCVRRQRPSCDVVTMNSLDRLREERDRLQRERREAEDALLAVEESSRKDIEDLLDSQRKRVEALVSSQRDRVAELVGRIRRLRRQEDVVKDRVIGVLSLEEELDREEETERAECEKEEVRQKELEVQQSSASEAAPSFFGVGFDLAPMSPSTEAYLTLVGQGSGDENRQASTSHSGGV
ncbi:hypothetical protein F5Y02DRAFT_103328 [Annulohypoxylon stygium]|nr:hypothetical protein F5Y02DRAFT_103328 [Annulohypoxylon stygium]